MPKFIFNKIRKFNKTIFPFAMGAILILGPIFYFSVKNPSQAQAAWYNSEWKYRKKLVIDNTQVSGTTNLTNFPILINFRIPELSAAQADGDDILFTSADGETQLDHEIEQFNDLSGDLAAWVEIPTLDYDDDTEIYLYYGNPSAADQSNATGVWDSDTDAVYHLDDDPTGTVTDSTSNSNSLSSNGSMTSSDIIDGQNGNAITFDGTDDYLDRANDTDFDYGTGDFTISGWFNHNVQIGTTGPFSSAVADGNDDAHENQSETNFSATNAVLQMDSASATGSRWNTGIRFPNLTIPQGSDILDATITAVVRATNVDSPELDIYFEDVDDADDFATTADVTSRTNTLASIEWSDTNIGAGTQTAPDVAILVDEVVKRPGWSSGNAMVALFRGRSTDDAENFRFRSYDFNSSVAALVSGTYEEPAYNYLVSRYNSDAGWKVYLKGGRVCFGIDDDSTWDVDDEACSSAATYDDNSWHHFSVVKDGTTGIYVYVDGTQVGSDTTIAATGTLNSTGALSLGADEPTAADYIDGNLDEVKIVGAERTADWIATEYNNQSDSVGFFSSLEPSEEYLEPILFWKFDEGSGSTANDTEGTNTTGTITNATWETSDCYFNNCLDFDGSGDYVATTADENEIDFEAGDSFTIEAWFKHDTIASAEDVLLAKYDALGADGGYRIQMESDGDITCGIDTDNSAFPLDSASSTTANYDDNQWHHVACVKNGSTNLTLYIDGIEIASDNSITAASIANNDNLYVGINGNATGNEWVGLIDEVKIYNYAKSADQVRGGFAAAGIATASAVLGTEGSDANMYAALNMHLKFDESFGDTGNDSINSNDADLGDSDTTCPTTGDCPTWTQEASCKYNTCLDFDGSDDIAVVTNATTIDLDGDLAGGFTFSTWINADSDGESNTGEIFDKGTNTYLRVSNESGSDLDLDASLDLASSNATVTVSAPITVNGWYHVALTYTDDADDEISIWVNGILLGTSTNGSGAPSTDTNNLIIGGSTATNFDGSIDDFKIYDVELSTSQMAIDFNAGSSVAFGVLGAEESTDLTDGELPSPIVYFDLNENTGTSTVNDKSGNGFSGTMNNMEEADWQPGKKGSALAFAEDTDNERITVSDNDTLTPTDITVETWIYMDSYPTDFPVIVGKTNNAGQREYRLRTESGTVLVWQVSTDGNDPGTNENSIVLSTYMPLNQWNHVVATFDDTANELNLYVNGELADTDTGDGGIFNGTADFSIGGYGDTAGETFTGLIDEVKVYDQVLTPAQAAYAYNRGGPIFWAKLDEGALDTCPSSADACDSSGFGNHGDSNGTMVNGDWVTGVFGGAVDFDGTDDYFDWTTITNSTNIDSLTDRLTITGWFKSDNSSGANEDIIARTNNSSQQHFDVYINSSNFLEADIGGTTVTSTTNVNSSGATWYHFAVTWDSALGSDQLKLYIDGIEEDTATLSSSITAHDQQLLIGRQGTAANYFDGQIDDVRIYNYALSEDQIKKIINFNSANFE